MSPGSNIHIPTLASKDGGYNLGAAVCQRREGASAQPAGPCEDVEDTSKVQGHRCRHVPDAKGLCLFVVSLDLLVDEDNLGDGTRVPLAHAPKDFKRHANHLESKGKLCYFFFSFLKKIVLELNKARMCCIIQEDAMSYF